MWKYHKRPTRTKCPPSDSQGVHRKCIISEEIISDNTFRVWQVKETLLVSIYILVVKSVTKRHDNGMSDFLNWCIRIQRRQFSELVPVTEKHLKID